MSSYLEPSFLLELGAYAVAAAGIRIFKSRYRRTGVLPSPDETPNVQQPEATVQAAPLGLGQASPLRAPTSPRWSPSLTLQLEPQFATRRSPQPLHKDSATPLPAHCSPLPAGEAAPGSAIDTDMAEAGTDEVEEVPAEFPTDEEQATENLLLNGLIVDSTAPLPSAPATATAVDSDEIGPDASRLDLKAHDAVTDMLPQPADEPSVPCSCVSSESLKDDHVDVNITDERETCGSADIEAPSHAPGMEAPSLNAKQHHEALGHLILQPGKLLTEAAEREGDHVARGLADRWGRANALGRSLPATGAAQAAETNAAAAAAASDALEATDRASKTAAQRLHALAAHAARQRARRSSQCCDLVSEPASAPDAAANIRERRCELRTAATSGHDAQAASEILATLSEGKPSFSKVACVGTTKACGADLMATSRSSAAGVSHLNGSAVPAEPAEVSSHDRAEASGQEAAEEDVSFMCESPDEEEGVAAISKRTTQDDSPPCFDLNVPHDIIPSSRPSTQPGSSELGLVMDGSGSDEELQPAEEVVVTLRDILLHAAQRCNADSGNHFPRDTSLSFIGNCFKQPCGSRVLGHTAARTIEAERPSSADTHCSADGDARSHQLLTELPVAPASPKVGPSPPSSGGVTPFGADHDPSRGPASTPAGSDCQPQEDRADQNAPGSSRATAQRPSSFLPIAASVFDDAPGPKSASDFDDAPMPVDAVMFDDEQLSSVQEEEEALPERSVEAVETGLVSEEERGQPQLQEPDQADAISHPTDTSPAVDGAGDEEERGSVRMPLHDSPAGEEEHCQVPCEQLDQASEPEPETESAVDTAHRRIRRYWHSRASLQQLTHSPKPTHLPGGDKDSINAKPSSLGDPGDDDSGDPGERKHVCGLLTKDQCTWEAMECLQHSSSEHHAQAEEEEWACVLNQVDSAPPVTPDSPNHSSAPPSSPSWGGSGGEWESAPRAAPDSCPGSYWDSPPRAAPHSPAFACSPAGSCRSRQRAAPRAVSSSPLYRATIPANAAWHSETQAATPIMHEPTPRAEKYGQNGNVVGGLDGDYACGSYASPPPPPTPISPSPPPSSPPHQSDTLPWRYGHFRTRIPSLDSPKSFSPQQSDTLPSKCGHRGIQSCALEILGAFPTRPESPIHHEEAAPDSPALVAPDDAQLHAEEQHDQEPVLATPLPYSCLAMWHESAAATAADKPQRWDSPPADEEEGSTARAIKQAKTIFGRHTSGTYEHQPRWTKSFAASDEEAQHREADTSGTGTEEGEGEGCAHEEGMEGAAAASSPEPVPGLQQTGEQEGLTEDSADERQGLEQGRAVFPSPQPSPEHTVLSSTRLSSESAPQDSHSKTPEANGHHLQEDTGEVGLLEEEDGADGPSGGQGHEQDRPVAASSPQPEQPETMMVDSEGEECFEDDEVQFVSETGADPSRSAFSAAVKRLAEDDSEIELYPGVQDLISGALHLRLARHSGQSAVDDEVDVMTNSSRGRGPLRRKRGCRTPPETRGRRPPQRGRQSFDRLHGQHNHSHDHHQLLCEEDVSPSRPVSAAAAVSAAAGSHGAGSGAAAAAGPSGRHARRLTDMLSVAEEEFEVEDMDADMTCWRKLLKKPRH